MRPPLLLVALSASFLLAAPVPPPRGPRECAALEGLWAVVSYEGEGGAGEGLGADLATGTLTLWRDRPCGEEFRDGKLVITDGWTGFRVDPLSRPKALDLLLGSPGDVPIVYRAIYELKGDTLRICRSVKEFGPRPDSFSAKKGSGRVLSTWRRVKK